MKKIKIILILVFCICTGIFCFVKYKYIPEKQEELNAYNAQQQNPLEHDFGAVLKYNGIRLSDTEKVGMLFSSLPLSNHIKKFELIEDKNNFIVYFDTSYSEEFNRSLIYNSAAGYVLIDDLQMITYIFDGKAYDVTKESAEDVFGDFTGYDNLSDWDTYIRTELKNEDSVSQLFGKMFTEA